MKELFIDYFNTDSILSFWQEVVNLDYSSDLDIYLNYESADLLAFSRREQLLLVKAFADKTCEKWTNLSENETNLTDEEFDTYMSQEINSILDLVKNNKPSNIKNVQYLTNWYKDYTYAGLYTKFIDPP